MNKNKRTDKQDYYMSDQHKKKYVDRNGLDPKNRYNNDKEKNGIQYTRERDTEIVKGSKRSI